MSTTTSPPTSAVTAPGPDDDAAKGGGRKKLVVVLLLVVALAGAGYWFVLKPGSSEPTEPVPGEVLVLEPVQVNLAAGHYLRVGLALQLVAGGGAHGEVDGSKALDATIELFTGRKVAELASTETRNELRADLLETLGHDYHGEVMAIYFTEFVTQ